MSTEWINAATVGRGRGAWSVWRPLLTRSGVLRERPAGASSVSPGNPHAGFGQLCRIHFAPRPGGSGSFILHAGAPRCRSRRPIPNQVRSPCPRAESREFLAASLACNRRFHEVLSSHAISGGASCVRDVEYSESARSTLCRRPFHERNFVDHTPHPAPPCTAMDPRYTGRLTTTITRSSEN